VSTQASDDDAVMVREVNGEILVLDNRSQQIHQLNGTASFIWRSHRQGACVQDTTAAFAAVFDVDDDTARSDVAKTLEWLLELNLLR
jgi:hypothetical protein